MGDRGEADAAACPHQTGPFQWVFVNLNKAFGVMERERSLLILEEHGVAPILSCLIRHFWNKATNVCCASGN